MPFIICIESSKHMIIIISSYTVLALSPLLFIM